MNRIILTKTIYIMKKTLKKTGYVSPCCEQIRISPQSQLLQIASPTTVDPVTLDAFGIYDDSTPYFG